jgi:N-acyl amino acid synthase of PEP-CTERM/exosortase system
MEDRFTFRKVEPHEKELLAKIYRLRFDVYCHECGFLREEDHPNKLDIDEYDSQSVHFAAIDTDGEVVGTIRMILPGALPLPVVKYCSFVDLGKIDYPRFKAVELSRFVISKKIRRRKDDDFYYGPKVVAGKIDLEKKEKIEEMRRSKPMAFGLYKRLYLESKALGITHWCTLMETSLWLLLWVHGFEFECLGGEVDVMGKVKPYIGEIPIIERSVSEKFPEFFEYFTSQEIKNIR